MDGLSENSAGSQSIDRALALLTLVAGHAGEEVPMPVLTRETGLSRPTVRRIMLALMRNGYIEQTPQGGYFPGPECIVVGNMAARRHNILDASMDSLIALAEQSGDSSFVSVRRGSYSVCLHREEGSYPIRTHVLQPGNRHPLGIGAGAMAILSGLPENEIEEVIAATREEVKTKFPGFDDAYLYNELAASQRRGWSLNPGMYVANSWAVGVPVRSPDNEVVGSLSIAAIDSRMGEKRQSALAGMLTLQAARTEERLRAQANRKPGRAGQSRVPADMEETLT